MEYMVYLLVISSMVINISFDGKNQMMLLSRGNKSYKNLSFGPP